MSDIKIQIKNYKLIKDYEQEHKNARILLVTGKNEIGKSSLIRGIIENITAKSSTPDPVSHGEETGSKTITIPDKDGGVITIVHDFSNANKSGTFYAIDKDGRKVKEVKKIRELVGIFEELSIDAFYTLAQSAPGRRKIITDYFYPQLTDDAQIRIESIDKSTQKGGALYDERTKVNQGVSYLEGAMNQNKPNQEDKVLAVEYDNISQEIERLESEKLKHKEDAVRSNLVKGQIAELEEELNEIPNVFLSLKNEFDEFVDEKRNEIEDLKKRIANREQEIVDKKIRYEKTREELHEKEIQFSIKLKNFKANVKDIPDYSELDNQISQVKAYRDQAYIAKGRIEKYEGMRNEIVSERETVSKLDQEINDLREEKKKILKESNLPAGLMIDGDEFTWNGFAFTDTQISKSSALLVIAEILCNVVESKIVYLGEKALFDNDRFKKLIKIAEKHGKIPVLEEVIDDQTELKVITTIQDV